MNKSISLLILSLTAGPLLLPTILQAGVMEYVSFQPLPGKEGAADPGELLDLEIDQDLQVVWDREGLLTYLAHDRGGAPAEDPLLRRISAVRLAAKGFFETQTRLMELQSAAMLRNATRASADSLKQAAARKRFDEAMNRYSEAGLAAFAAVDEIDPEYYAVLKPLLDRAILEADYTAVGRVLQESIGALASELVARLESGGKIQVFMQATLTDYAGSRIPVHLDGYDAVPLGEPMPFPRDHFLVDGRTRADIKAADEAATVIRGFANGTFATRARESLDDLLTEWRDLSDSLQVRVLDDRLRVLQSDLGLATDEWSGPLLTEIVLVRDLLRPLADPELLSGGSRSEDFLALTETITVAARRVQEVGQQLPTELGSLIEDIEQLALRQPALVRQGAVVELKAALARFRSKQSYFNNLYEGFSKLAGILQLGEGIRDRASEIPRDIGENLDTNLSLQSIQGERHPGDRLTVSVRVMRVDSAPEQLLASGQQGFRLEAYGPYPEVRGGLIFVDPRTHIPRDLSFVPVPAVSFHWRLGIRGFDFWNRVLAPGLGASLALLDFDDHSTMEVGIAPNITLFSGLLWSGYGRNLQARADYFYVGVNPLVLAAAVRRGGL